ncbi:hypothetical protein TRFO_17460 [Tritrichomonas foetus]|uniref:Uncharacterized protein n=1 Tax=Tritrichomonas foetus TaxID=1144522 RepID=A0A1J4KMV2_9EUKA|nr:hypothetical protein TRFO_17460 [Tritrichomonas foetus]|eukprot:OHT12641.1 hypothetical protein TRFO_17460 [Tritrichomonas foetus]
MNPHVNPKEIEENDSKYDLREIGNIYMVSEKEPTHQINIKELSSALKYPDQIENSLKNNDIAKIQEIFNVFLKILLQSYIPKNEHIELIDKMLPYILRFLNSTTPPDLLLLICHLILTIVDSSKYYSISLTNPSLFGAFVQVLQNVNKEEINEFLLNTVNIIFYNNDNLSTNIFSYFHPQILVLIFQNINGHEAKKEVVQLFINYFRKENIKFDITASELLISSLLQCLLSSGDSFDDLKMLILSAFGAFSVIYTDYSIELFTKLRIYELLEKNILSILTFKGDENLIIHTFYSLYKAVHKKLTFSFPVKEIYQLIIDEQISEKVGFCVIGILSNMINNQDSIEFNQLFIQPNVIEMIHHIMNGFSIELKNATAVIVGVVVATHNFDMIKDFVTSSVLTNIIDLMINEYDPIFMGGILVSMLFIIKDAAPEGEIYHHFISVLIENNLLDHLEQMILNVDDQSHTIELIHSQLLQEINSYATNG